jgi:vacuolar protein sorting-associated protein 26
MCKYEILDGSPNEKDIVPIRLYLDCYGLSPTYKLNDFDINVNYFLKFVVIDQNEKVYFKQQELFLWRNSF